MNQIKWIQLGVIAICIATVPLSPAQTPRIQTSGNNQTTTTAPRLSISSGNSTRAPQIGINPGSATNIGVTTNAGAHTTTNAGAQIGIQAIGITRAAAQNSISRGNSMASTQNGINIATSTNTTANTNTAAETSKGAGAGTGVKKITLPDIVLQSTPSPDLSTPTPTPTPIPDPTPIPSPSVGPSPSPSPQIAARGSRVAQTGQTTIRDQ